jgi:hypothetical protein
VLVEPLAHVGLALLKLHLQLHVIDVIARAGVAVDGVWSFVEVAAEGDAHRAALRAAAEEIVLAVVEHVEERPGNGFEDGGLARAVGADDGGRPALERVGTALERLDVLQLDPCDVHALYWDARAAEQVRRGGAVSMSAEFKTSAGR